MEQTIPADLRRLRVTGLIEGTSTLVLFFIAMPLKYAADMPMAVTIVGNIHGILFLLYVALAFLAKRRYAWPWGRMLALWIAAVVPFGPFIMDRYIARWYLQDQAAQRQPTTEESGPQG